MSRLCRFSLAHILLLLLLILVAGCAGTPPVSLSVKEPFRVKAEAEKETLQALKIGVGPFRDLYFRYRGYVGIGYDYAEDVIIGIKRTGFFVDVELTNDLEDPQYDYVVSGVTATGAYGKFIVQKGEDCYLEATYQNPCKGKEAVVQCDKPSGLDLREYMRCAGECLAWQIIRLEMGHLELESQDVKGYCKRGDVYLDRGDYDLSILDYRSAIELNPQSAIAYARRGNAYREKQKLDWAIKDLDKAIELDPQLAFAYFRRGTAYSQKGEYDKGISDLSKAVELNPKDAKPYVNRGLCYYHKGDYDKAIADYDKAIELNREFAYPYNNRGLAYEKKGNFDQAVADLKKALEIDPESALAQSNLKRVQEKQAKQKGGPK